MTSTVLVVDDQHNNRELVRAFLEPAGHVVLLAASGADALAVFEQHRPDIVLLDVVMPGMDGFTVLERIRALPCGPDTPVVFLTALDDLTTQKRAIRLGVDDFLTKPLNRTELLIRVQSLVRIKRLSRERDDNLELIREQRDAVLRAQAERAQVIDYVVHDLKNPLTSVLLNSSFVGADDTLSIANRDAIRDILASADMMYRMVLNLLDVSRSESGTLNPVCAAVDLDRLLDNIVVESQRRAADGQIRLSVDPPGQTPCQVSADRDLLRRVIDNLIDNCIKYTPAGGSVSLSLAKAPGGWCLSVADQGRGVPDAVKDRIFEPYVRLGEAREHRNGSRGLGLAFCRAAVKAMAGRIWVTDNQPHGAVFRIELPEGSP